MKSEKETSIIAATPRAGRREWIGLGVIALPCILYSMDLTVLNLALPHLSAELKPSSVELLWIIDIYGFMVAGFLITMGTLGDRIGRRKLLLIGAIAFGIASVFAAYATSSEMLITARAMLGIAGATLAPSTLSLIRNMFHDSKQRTIAIGIWITSYSLGGAIGPIIGGVVLQHFWWGAVFLIAVPVMILLLLIAPILLPEYRDPNAGRLDLMSAVLSLLAVLSFIFGLKKIAESGLKLIPILSIVVGLAIGILFLQRQKKLADPLIDLKLFSSRAFGISLLIYTLATFVAFSSFIYLFQFLQLVVGLTPLETGLWSLPFFIAFIIGSTLSPIIVRRAPAAKIMAGGLLIASIGFGLLIFVSNNSGPAYLVIAAFIYCLGLAPVFTIPTDFIVGSAPPERAGAASAISETGSEFGGALGIAVIGSVGTFVYRTQMTANIPGGISSKAAFEATNTLGAAVAEARLLPLELRSALMDSASKAFVSSMQVVAMICALMVLLMAYLCLKQLGNTTNEKASTSKNSIRESAPLKEAAGTAQGH